MPPRSDPVFTVRCFPACDDIPQLTLTSLSTKVRSPHSPTGYALAKKSVWIARVWKQVAQDDEIGLGWQGEWVLEGHDAVEPRQKWSKSNKSKLSRKELRKQERTGLKQRKAEFFSASHKRTAEEEHAESPQRKKVKLAPREAVSNLTPSIQTPPTPAPADDSTIREPVKTPKPAKTTPKPKTTALEKLARRKDPAPASLLPRSQKEKEEDAYIAYLEAKLGYGGGKKKKRENDGLDDLFDSLANFAGSPSETDGSEGDDSEVDEDDNVHSEDDSLSDADDDEEWHGIQPEDIDSDDQDGEANAPTDAVSPAKHEPGTAYVPPHLRKRSQDEPVSEAMIKLTRQLKGLLNRMTEQNIASILDSIEEIYRKHSRNDVTSTLTTLIVDGISSHSSLLDSYVVLHAAFVSSLHKIVGIEFAAFFVQKVVSEYEQHYAASKDAPDQAAAVSDNAQTGASTSGKEGSNLIVLLSELYNFQVISCVLVFDIIRGLLDTDLSEYSVELLLKIVRNSGQQLRQDDPSALKDIIQIVQSKISDSDEALGSRTRFMVETLTNLKNNKLKRNVTLNQGADAVERMKKFLTGLSKSRHAMAHEPLRVSLQDLHSAESKGKWWLVGAAWGGDPLVDRQDEAPAKREQQTAPNGDSANTALLKLAKKQGMNTDIRRSIFVILMSSDDYVDACERLSQLSLTEVQQREIVRVLLHCCGNEKSYNPYYVLVCQHLCRSSHAYKITLQFCLWDFLRDLGEANVGGAEVLKNLKDGDNDGGGGIRREKYFADADQECGKGICVVDREGLCEPWDSQGTLKFRIRTASRAKTDFWMRRQPVDFTTLKPQSREFLKELMVQLFVSSQISAPVVAAGTDVTTRNRGPVEEIFIKASRVEALAMGLVYFLTEAFRDVDEMPEGMGKLVRWASGVAKDTLRTGVDIVPSL
ncbi:MIF4G/MA4-domain-containing protein [Mycena sanguinolenta]|uniref:MIF4G/MA4-domain-containing protein n=1 Tax=Mycena sanguinolenta TaxID=230812 RepID=A0A8H6ZC55_9AGAR|nr:MIF4G/MA4-domain-containing protein [Mycena sanguinolenta]